MCDPLRGLAWLMRKNVRLFRLLACPATLCGIGVADVQTLTTCATFCGTRAALCRNRRGRFAKFGDMPTRPSAGIGAVDVRKLQGFATLGSACVECDPIAKRQLHRDFAQRSKKLAQKTCAERLEYINSRRELAQRNLRR